MHHWNGSSHSHYSGLTLSSRGCQHCQLGKGVVHVRMQKVEEASRMTRGFVVGAWGVGRNARARGLTKKLASMPNTTRP